MKIKISKLSYIKTIFWIFSFLFVSPILSPQINGSTIYLNWFIPFLDIDFLKYISGYVQRLSKRITTIFLLLLCVTTSRGEHMVMIKSVAITFSLVYLQYAYVKIGFSMLYKAFNINIVIAVIQFVLYCIDPIAAYRIGPGNIADTIWGGHATKTFTNFFPVFWKLPRTCGLSREAGFFSALLGIMIMVYCFDKKVEKKLSQIFLYTIAFVISFSKMSMMLPIIWSCMLLRRYINKIPLAAGFCIIWSALGCISIYLNQIGYFVPAHESLSHRLYGYGIVFGDLSLKETLIGDPNGILRLNGLAVRKWPIYQYLLMHGQTTFCGYPQLIICFGYIGIGLFLMILYLMRVETAGMFILLFATFDVDLTTTTSFVVLAYWFVFYGIKYHDPKMPRLKV